MPSLAASDPDTEEGPWGQGQGPSVLAASAATQEPAAGAKPSRCRTSEETARQGVSLPPGSRAKGQ